MRARRAPEVAGGSRVGRREPSSVRRARREHGREHADRGARAGAAVAVLVATRSRRAARVGAASRVHTITNRSGLCTLRPWPVRVVAADERRAGCACWCAMHLSRPRVMMSHKSS